MTRTNIMQVINQYLEEQLSTRLYVGHCPDADFDRWVERVGIRLAAHPEVKAELNNRLHYIHAEAERYLRNHEDYTGAMPRLVRATEKWLDAIGPATGADAISFLIGLTG